MRSLQKIFVPRLPGRASTTPGIRSEGGASDALYWLPRPLRRLSARRPSVSGWTWAWIAWLGAFVAIEGKALFNKTKGDTLSEHVWKWFATQKVGNDPTGWVRLRRFTLLAFMAWLSVHFLTGGKF
jgi:hypothetical protein